MKRLIIILTFTLIASCKDDCYQTITGVDLQGSKQFGELGVETQFMNKTIILNAILGINQKYPQFSGGCKDPLMKTNSIIDSTIKLFCDKDFFLSTDTLYSKKDNLIDWFEVYNKAVGRDQFVSLRNKQSFRNQNGFYTFFFICKLSSGLEISDSCTLKIDF